MVPQKTKSRLTVSRIDRASERLLALAAHDLRNPLAAIFGYADALLETKLGQGLRPNQRRCLQRIKGTSLRGLELVKNLQQLDRIDGRRPSPVKRPCEVESALDAVLDDVHIPPERIISIKRQRGVPGLQVKMEPHEFERVISNLVSNAMKFTPDAGEIFISTAAARGPRILITVRNTGSYIPPRERSAIFRRAYRGQSARGGVTGSGLGLFIARSLVKARGGTISVDSDSGGTSFTVTLPQIAKPGVLDQPEPQTSSRRVHMK